MPVSKPKLFTDPVYLRACEARKWASEAVKRKRAAVGAWEPNIDKVDGAVKKAKSKIDAVLAELETKNPLDAEQVKNLQKRLKSHGCEHSAAQAGLCQLYKQHADAVDELETAKREHQRLIAACDEAYDNYLQQEEEYKRKHKKQRFK